jgi:hypothetical protein
MACLSRHAMPGFTPEAEAIDGMDLALESSQPCPSGPSSWHFATNYTGDWTAIANRAYIYIPSLCSSDTQMSSRRNISRYGTSARTYR